MSLVKQLDKLKNQLLRNSYNIENYLNLLHFSRLRVKDFELKIQKDNVEHLSPFKEELERSKNSIRRFERYFF